jgi:hypothetical protein
LPTLQKEEYTIVYTKNFEILFAKLKKQKNINDIKPIDLLKIHFQITKKENIIGLSLFLIFLFIRISDSIATSIFVDSF